VTHQARLLLRCKVILSPFPATQVFAPDYCCIKRSHEAPFCCISRLPRPAHSAVRSNELLFLQYVPVVLLYTKSRVWQTVRCALTDGCPVDVTVLLQRGVVHKLCADQLAESALFMSRRSIQMMSWPSADELWLLQHHQQNR
jgi:hypothetical protein